MLDHHTHTHLPIIVRWRNAIQAADVPATTKLVCYTLAQYMGPDGGSAWPSLGRIAADARLTTRSVRAHLNRAERCGLIRRERRGQGYQFWPALVEEEPVSAPPRNDVPPNKTITRIRPTIQPAPEPDPEPAPEPDPEPPEPPDRDDGEQEVTPEQVVALFNALLAEQLQPQRKVAPVRDAIEAILDERPEAERLSWWRRRFQAVAGTSWMTGSMGSRWKASLYWLVRPDRNGRLGIDKIELAPDRAPGLAGRDFTGISRNPERLFGVQA